MDAFSRMRLAAQSMPGLRQFFQNGPDLGEGERLLQGGEYGEAERFFEQLISQGKARAGKKGRLGRMLLALGKARLARQNEDGALEAVKEAIEDLEGVEPSSELAGCHDLIAQIETTRGDLTAAIKHLEGALEAQKAIRPLNPAAIIERQRKLSDAYGETGDWTAALSNMEQAAAMAEKECGAAHRLTADCLTGWGRCLAEVGDHVAARKQLERALELHLSLCGQDSEEAARDYQALAVAHRAAEEYETAVKYYEQALRLRERQLGGNSADFAELLVSLAGAHSMQGHYGPAVELLQQAVGKYSGARDRRLAPALQSLGTVYLLCGRIEDSIRSLKQARKIWEHSPERFQNQLQSNTQLFETVSSYLTARDAATLLASIQHQPEEAHVFTESPAVPEPKPTPAPPSSKVERPAARPEQEVPAEVSQVWPEPAPVAAPPLSPGSYPVYVPGEWPTGTAAYAGPAPQMYGVQPPVSADAALGSTQLTAQLAELSSQLAQLNQVTMGGGPPLAAGSPMPVAGGAVIPGSGYAPAGITVPLSAFSEGVVRLVSGEGVAAGGPVFAPYYPVAQPAATGIGVPAPVVVTGDFALTGWDDLRFEYRAAICPGAETAA